MTSSIASNDGATAQDGEHSRSPSPPGYPSSEASALNNHVKICHNDRCSGLADGATLSGAYPETSGSTGFLSATATGNSMHTDESTSSKNSPTTIAEELNSHAAPTSAKHQYWTSIWLHKLTLLGIAGLFASLAAALIVLWFANKAQDGFAPTLTTNHYAWTYGPTAILVVVLSFWRQVDFHCKAMQPWQQLFQGPASADRSMLLDYLSPIQITSFITAIRYRHVPVAASIAGFAILKLVILISTGLLVLAPVLITETISVNLISAFDSDSFWSTVPKEFYAVALDHSGEYTYRDISAHAVHSFLNTLKEDSAKPADIANNVVFQSIVPEAEMNLSSISVKVDSFVPKIACEVAHPTVANLGYDGWLSDLKVQLDSTTCSVGGNNQTTLEVITRSPQCSDGCAKDQWVSRNCYGCTQWTSFNFWRVNCSQEPDIDYNQFPGATDLLEYNILDANLSYDFRFAMMVSNLTFEPIESGLSTNKPIAHQTAAVICDIDYSMQSSLVTQNFVENTTSVDSIAPKAGLGNLTGTALSEILFAELLASQNVIENHWDWEQEWAIQPLYTILLETLDGNQSMDRLLSSETLLASANQTLAGLSAHFVRENFLKRDNTKTSGTAKFSEDRLRIGVASLWIMVAGLILLATLTICIVFSRPQEVLPHEPGCISTDAIVLASSPCLQGLLKPCNNMRTSQITDMLHDIKFRADNREGFQIIPTCDELVRNPNERKAKRNPWMPLSATYLMIVPTLTMPILVLISLEVLYRVSEKHGGVVDVSGSEDTATYISRYLSALVVLGIATCFNGLYFTVASFAPYDSLRSGAVPASRGLRLQILGAFPPIALANSIRGRHTSSFFSNIAGMIGSALTIIASGLWVVDRAVGVQHGATASLSTNWDLEWLNGSSYSDDGATATFDQIQHGSALMPPTIWNGVVLPDIEEARSDGDFSAQIYTFRTYGLRPLLSCEVVADEFIFVETGKAAGTVSTDLLVVEAVVPIPNGCQSSVHTDTKGYYNFSSTSYSIPEPAYHVTYMGGAHDLHLEPKGSHLRSPQPSEDIHNPEMQRGNPENCPSLGIIFAEMVDDKTPRENVNVLVCTQKLQNIDMNVTYSGFGTLGPTIDLETAPVLDEDSVRNVTNLTNNFDSFSYQVETYFDPSPFNVNITKFNYGSGLDKYLEPFLDHAAYGPGGIAPQDMVGKSNQDNLIKAVQNVYARWMSIIMDMRLRRPLTEEKRDELPESKWLLHGTAHNVTSRLQLTGASKLTMQIMLGVMFLLGTLTYLLSDLRGSMPRKPTTIASRMALLAGSDLCDEGKALIPPNATCMRKSELDKVFDGWLFSLGWWREDESSADNHSEQTAVHEGAGSVIQGKQESRRFGIDVGVAERTGFRETKLWVLRRRITGRTL